MMTGVVSRSPLSYPADQAAIRSTFIAMLGFTLGAGIFYALTPAFGRDTLGASTLAYGVMIGAMGCGAVLGGSVLKRLRQRMPPRILVTATMAFFGVFIALASRVHGIPAAMGLLGTGMPASAAGGVLADRFGIRAAMTTGAAICLGAAFSTWKLGLPGSFTGTPLVIR